MYTCIPYACLFKNMLMSVYVCFKEPGAISPTVDSILSSSQNNPSTSTAELPGPSSHTSEDGTTAEDNEDAISSFSTANIVSPEAIRPFPKAPARKEKPTNRRKRDTMILTDTPVRNALAEVAKSKNAKTVKRKLPMSTEPTSKIAKKKVPSVDEILNKISSRSSDTDSDSSNLSEITDLSEDNLSEMSFCHSEQDEDDGDIEVGNYVVVAFATKSTMHHYVGQIQQLEVPSNDEIVTKFMRKRSGEAMNFYFPEADDISSHPREDIVLKLPKPEQIHGTKRTQNSVKFPIDLKMYNMF